jgi:hypothetical protein
MPHRKRDIAGSWNSSVSELDAKRSPRAAPSLPGVCSGS